MPTVNALRQWREVIAPASAKTVGEVKQVLTDGRLELELRDSTKINVIGTGYEVGDFVLVADGMATRKVVDLPVTSQGV